MAKACNSVTAFTDFKNAFCEHFGCSAEAFLPRLFAKSLDPGWRAVASGIQRISPNFFARDLHYLERIGEARSWHEVAFLANSIRSDEALNHGLLRKTLHLRISGARLMKLREEITKARQSDCR